MKPAIVTVAACIVLMLPSTVLATRQVACPRVISELNKVSKSEDNAVLAMEKVAKRLQTNALWVENCMRIYGRAVPRRISIDQDLREEMLERLEERDVQPEDQDREDQQQPDPFREPEAESAGNKKRKPGEYIHRYQYLPK
jgi:hypothetical protein